MEFLKRPGGASEADIANLQATYHFKVPEDLRRFWLESDGAILWFGYKELQFFTLNTILEDIYTIQKYMPGAVPLCIDGNGNLCVACINEAQVYGYYVVNSGNLSWDDARPIAKTFEGLLGDGVSPERRLNA